MLRVRQRCELGGSASILQVARVPTGVGFLGIPCLKHTVVHAVIDCIEEFAEGGPVGWWEEHIGTANAIADDDVPDQQVGHARLYMDEARNRPTGSRRMGCNDYLDENRTEDTAQCQPHRDVRMCRFQSDILSVGETCSIVNVLCLGSRGGMRPEVQEWQTGMNISLCPRAQTKNFQKDGTQSRVLVGPPGLSFVPHFRRKTSYTQCVAESGTGASVRRYDYIN